ncbi:MAG TPA: response regulator [Terriglobia bacterium]|nr:response regulator [Terriglobia bacterium]
MQKTILIVDFERESLEELQQVLRGEDFLVLTAVDGQQALSVFQATKPDLVVTEALLPKLNGFELCKKITKGELRDVRPVIIYSAIYKGEKYQKEAVAGCGAAEFLDKPIPKWLLLKAVRSALSEPTPKKVAKEVEVAPLPGIDSVKSPQDWGDPLEIDALFDIPASTPVPEPVISNPAATVVLEAPAVEAKPVLIPSIDSREIDDALDAVRVDLHVDPHQEARQRDEMLARQFEQELGQSGQSILEFEASIASTAQMTPGEVGNGELELDDVTGVTPPVATAETAAPSFATKPSSSKSWLPILILILLAVMAGVYFWFWS